MTPVPLDLPLRPSEAAEVANLIFEHAERKPLTDEIRNRVAARASVLRLETLTPYFGSLARDPIHPSAYYLAVDGQNGEPFLLYMAPAAAPTSSIFHKPLLIGRMRRPGGPELVINAVAFGPADFENLDKFTGKIDGAFLPKPQGSRSAIAAVPAADTFDSFRAIWKSTGKNLAAISGGSLNAYYSGVWSAIRAGWREGYSAAIAFRAGTPVEALREAIREAAGFTVFALDIAPLLEPVASSAEQRFEQAFTAEERGWIFDEFARPFDLGDALFQLEPRDIVKSAARCGHALKAFELFQELVRQARAAKKLGRAVDFELSFESADEPTAPADLLFCLNWLKARGHAAQQAAPRFNPADLNRLAAIARHFQCTLSTGPENISDEAALEEFARATSGRLNYKAAPGASITELARNLFA